MSVRVWMKLDMLFKQPKNLCSWILSVIWFGKFEANSMDLWMGLIIHRWISKPKHLTFVSNNLIFGRETTKPFLLIMSKKNIEMLKIFFYFWRKDLNIINMDNCKILKIIKNGVHDFLKFRWGVFKPKSITFHSYCPNGTMKVVLYLFGICICQKPNFISNVGNTLAFKIILSKSCLFGIWYLIHSNTFFKG